MTFICPEKNFGSTIWRLEDGNWVLGRWGGGYLETSNKVAKEVENLFCWAGGGFFSETGSLYIAPTVLELTV